MKSEYVGRIRHQIDIGEEYPNATRYWHNHDTLIDWAFYSGYLPAEKMTVIMGTQFNPVDSSTTYTMTLDILTKNCGDDSPYLDYFKNLTEDHNGSLAQ